MMALKDYAKKIGQKGRQFSEYLEKKRIQKEEREKREYEKLKVEGKKAELELSRMKASDRYKHNIQKVKSEKLKRSTLGGFLGGGTLPLKTSEKSIMDMGLGQKSRENFDMLGASSGLFGQAQQKPKLKKRKSNKRKSNKGGRSVTVRF